MASGGAAGAGRPSRARAVGRVSAALSLALRRHFDYPAVARRRGWEGDVTLGLRVQADGRVDDVRVVTSSGRRVLDRAALASARRVRRLPEAVAWLAGRGIELELPIRYRLRSP